MKEYATCAEARDEFSALLDGELDADAQEGLERHLAECSDCLRDLDGLKKVSDTYRELPAADLPEDFAKSIHGEFESADIDLYNSGRVAQAVSFKPVLVALAALALMAMLSYSISTFLPSDEAPAPALVENAE